MPSPSGKRWWHRAAAAAKDHCSLCLARSDLEVALIKATSHDASSVDYKNAGRVFAWAKTSPESSLPLLLSLLSRRLRRTRSWAVALKGLLLAHGLLLCSPSIRLLPFDLSSFCDPSSPPAFSAFVRAYFAFLTRRSPPEGGPDNDDLAHLRRLQGMQDQLDLLMQVRPYGDGMSAPLILEAMDCVVVEIFDVYSGVCNGIASALVAVFGSSSFWKDGAGARRGSVGIRVLRRARDQSARLTQFFDVCRGLGVINAAELPVVDSIAEEDIEELEKIVAGHGEKAEEEETATEPAAAEEEKLAAAAVSTMRTVVTREWVVFDGEQSGSSRMSRNPFLCSGTPWELHPVYSHHSLCHHHHQAPTAAGGGGGGWEGRDLLAL